MSIFHQRPFNYTPAALECFMLIDLLQCEFIYITI